MVRPPHTGIIYTPPDWSDHVAVAALLDLTMSEKVQLQSDAATRDCQPHTKQKKIVDLFARAVPKGAQPPAAAAEAAPKKQKTVASAKFSAFFNKQ
jgi:hypothetical protein